MASPTLTMASPPLPPTLLYTLLSHPAILASLTARLSRADLCSLRLASPATCNLLTAPLFRRLTLTFTPSSFTRPSRLAALSRIGHHIHHLTFSLPHSPSTFLPPLLHPTTGRELGPFLYTPHTTTAAARPTYATPELGEILTAQYPPLFHAACNVPSFLAALGCMTGLRHLTIKTPGQPPEERYRRGVVDYALLSLRIAVERSPAMGGLRKLGLSGVHPGAFQYLVHGPGAMGAGPGAGRRWRQIEALRVVVEGGGGAVGGDQVKMMEEFVRGVAGGLVRFEWEWRGEGRGPCPLGGFGVVGGGEGGRKLFNEVTGPMSPLPGVPSGRGGVAMPRLRYMAVRNCTMRSAGELRAVICAHRGTVREFVFENVALMERGRGWEEALNTLTETREKGADKWGRYSLGSAGSGSSGRPGTARSGSSSGVTSSVGDELTGESAAAAAASRELFEVDMEGMVFGGVNDVDAALDAGVEEWARGVTAAGPETIPEEQEDRGLTSEVEAAKEASLGFSTKLKKRRMIKKSRSSQDSSVVDDSKSHDHKSERSETPEHSSRSRHKHSRSDDTSDRRPSRDRSHSHSRRHRRPRSEDTPPVPTMPEVIGTDDEDFYRPPTPPKTPPRTEPRVTRKMSITAPILNADPFPVLLQPTVYDPSSKTAPFVSVCEVRAEHDDGLSPAQRLLEADMLAEARDAAARSSALKRAKETVLMKLSREFCKRSKAAPHSKDSAAVTAGLSALNLGMGTGVTCATSPSMGMGMRIREGLFGRSLANVAVVADHRSMDSQSALVPLMFSRG